MAEPVKRSRATPLVALGAVLLPVAAAAVVLFCFDPRRYHFYPPCFFHQTTGLLCAGCGALRALHQLLHGHLATAFQFNPLLVVSLPLLCWFGVRWALRRLNNQSAGPGFRPTWLWGLLVALAAFTLLRNVPGLPFAMLPP